MAGARAGGGRGPPSSRRVGGRRADPVERVARALVRGLSRRAAGRGDARAVRHTLGGGMGPAPRRARATGFRPVYAEAEEQLLRIENRTVVAFMHLSLADRRPRIAVYVRPKGRLGERVHAADRPVPASRGVSRDSLAGGPAGGASRERGATTAAAAIGVTAGSTSRRPPAASGAACAAGFPLESGAAAERRGPGAGAARASRALDGALARRGSGQDEAAAAGRAPDAGPVVGNVEQARRSSSPRWAGAGEGGAPS